MRNFVIYIFFLFRMIEYVLTYYYVFYTMYVYTLYIDRKYLIGVFKNFNFKLIKTCIRNTYYNI